MKERMRPCFPMEDVRPDTYKVKYLQDELEIRTRGFDAAANYIAMQLPNKSGSFSAIIAAFAIGIGVGIVVVRYFSIIPM